MANRAAPQPAALTARLFALNLLANKAGLPTAVAAVDPHNGCGSFSISDPGDTLQFAAARGGSGCGFGGKGVNTQCEVLITGPGIGTGVSLFSDGVKYQMDFGS